MQAVSAAGVAWRERWTTMMHTAEMNQIHFPLQIERRSATDGGKR